MKTYRSLYPRITTWSNLMLAWRKARRGKRYTSAAASFEQNLDAELLSIQRDLTAETYRPGTYRSFSVREPKRRKISAAPFRDRVVHHALCNLIEPIYERKFIADSYANRVGKGTHAALGRCTQFTRRYRYVLPLNVEQFFPAIDHAILKQILARTIACLPTLRLCRAIIDSGRGILDAECDPITFPGDDLFAASRPRGLPIGNLTSQFWANVYLNELDQYAKHTLRITGYLRYVDDVLLFADSKTTLHGWRDAVVAHLHTLRLTIHTDRAQPRPVTQGLPFLGFTVYPHHRRLKRRKGIAYRRHLKTLAGQYRQGSIAFEDVNASVQAWLGHASHGDTWSLCSALFREVTL